jgi:hypothetical protein
MGEWVPRHRQNADERCGCGIAPRSPTVTKAAPSSHQLTGTDGFAETKRMHTAWPSGATSVPDYF